MIEKLGFEIECYGCVTKFDILEAHHGGDVFYCPHCNSRLYVGTKLVDLSKNIKSKGKIK